MPQRATQGQCTPQKKTRSAAFRADLPATPLNKRPRKLNAGEYSICGVSKNGSPLKELIPARATIMVKMNKVVVGSECVLRVVVPITVVFCAKQNSNYHPYFLRNPQMCKQDDSLNLQVQTGDNVVQLTSSSEMEELRGQTELQQQTLQEIMKAQKQLEQYAQQMRKMMEAEHA